MEGPTPISALIHAATMVTLGVFLIIRANCFPTFFSIEFSTSLVLFTFLLSSHIGIFEDDSKKAIAYSTCSHLSIMILACLDLNESLAFFHLINHGFFKALLFLSMGNIIHSDYPQEQDSDFFADELSFSIPITILLFDLSILSLCSFFFTSASFSKEEIIDEDE
jgi:NADH-ubiquinone oxidoreductase chain 5